MRKRIRAARLRDGATKETTSATRQRNDGHLVALAGHSGIQKTGVLDAAGSPQIARKHLRPLRLAVHVG